MEIIGNCDTQLFLGCTDEMTAKFISDRTGEVTIGVESTAKELTAMRMTNYTPSHRETSSIGKRKLLTPDEVLRLSREDALVIFRGQKVLKVKKFDYTKHPESKKMRDCNARDYIPNWRLEQEISEDDIRFSDDDFATKREPLSSEVQLDESESIQEAIRDCCDEDIVTIPSIKIANKKVKPIPTETPRSRTKPSTATAPVNKSQPQQTAEAPFGAIDIDDLLSDL